MKNTLRVECSGGCGRLVLKEKGECRKCRRARILAANRHLHRLGEAIPQRNSGGMYIKGFQFDRMRAWWFHFREMSNAALKKARRDGKSQKAIARKPRPAVQRKVQP